MTLADGLSLTGCRALYDWRAGGGLTVLAADVATNAHDIAWAWGKDAFWSPVLEEYDAHTGEKLLDVRPSPSSDLADVNHCQPLDEDATAVLSSRATSAILKVGGVQGDDYSYEWVLGGPDGTVPIRDFDGAVRAPGSSLWTMQHNAEYMGEGRYYMIDNQFGTGNNSRLLSVVYDGSDGAYSYAYLEFEYEFDGNSPVFGDHDRLPTGHSLGCYWPSTVYSDASSGPTYDELAVEVTPDGAEAWTLEVYSEPDASCADDDGGCVRDSGAAPGWFFYSIERFYDGPLVFNATCSAQDGALAFSAVNAYKQSCGRGRSSGLPPLSLAGECVQAVQRVQRAVHGHRREQRRRGRVGRARVRRALARDQRHGRLDLLERQRVHARGDQPVELRVAGLGHVLSARARARKAAAPVSCALLGRWTSFFTHAHGFRVCWSPAECPAC